MCCDNVGALLIWVLWINQYLIYVRVMHHMTEDYNSFLMVPHMVYLVILVTMQRQFINVRYHDVSKVVNMVRIGAPI